MAHGLPYDAQEGLRVLRSADRTLARLIDRVGPFALELRERHNVYEALARSIIYQQLTGRSAAAIHARVHALGVRNRWPAPARLLELSPESLRAAGLSAGKLASLRDLAERTANGSIPSLRRLQAMSDEEIVERLTEVRGIGRWTVEMLLLFRLGRPDVLPSSDYGIRKGFAHTYKQAELPSPAALTAYGEKWRPYRSIASWYLWRAADLAGKGPAESKAAVKKVSRRA